jgi:hypothetical protein
MPSSRWRLGYQKESRYPVQERLAYGPNSEDSKVTSYPTRDLVKTTATER